MTTTAEALTALADVLATDSRDWSRTRGDAWLYGVLVGWDCEDAHDHELEGCEGAVLSEVADQHGWTAAQRSRLRELRQAIRNATAGARLAETKETP